MPTGVARFEGAGVQRAAVTPAERYAADQVVRVQLSFGHQRTVSVSLHEPMVTGWGPPSCIHHPTTGCRSPHSYGPVVGVGIGGPPWVCVPALASNVAVAPGLITVKTPFVMNRHPNRDAATLTVAWCS